MEVVFATAKALARAIREHQVSAVEALDAHLARIERHNPSLNALVTLDEPRARQRARAADAALARGEIWGPLHGVPFTLKDCHETAGMRTTVGFPPLAGYVPQDDSPVVARLQRAGGVLLGKTNVPTWLADYQTDNPLFGRTNNPWDLTRTPGGSSGGAAAAVAAGLTPFDIGTDLWSSIRLPAHVCGVFGLKPTERRIPLTGAVPDPQHAPRSVRLMSCIGPLARSVDDLALLYQVIAGPDGRDTDVAPLPVESPPALQLRDLRIAVAPAFPGLPVAEAISAALLALAAQLDAAGAHVEAASLPARAFPDDLAAAGALVGLILGATQPQESAQAATLAQYVAALHVRDQAIQAWEEWFANWDVLICPAAMVSAFPHCAAGSPLTVDGKQMPYDLIGAYGAIFNYTGHPAVVLPTSRGRDGLPLGVQVVARRWHEARLLAIAAAVEPIAGGFQAPPGYGLA